MVGVLVAFGKVEDSLRRSNIQIDKLDEKVRRDAAVRVRGLQASSLLFSRNAHDVNP